MSPQSATAMQPVKATASSKQDVDIFSRANQILDSISHRAFELFESNGRWHGRDLEDWFRAESEQLHPLHFEVAESCDKLTVQAEVPGTLHLPHVTLASARLLRKILRESIGRT
jgi:hypothetical protein